jgi:HJR/Mrr/RecB family endonuclease
MIETLVVHQLYSNEEIFKSLGVSNAGGIRLSLEQSVVTRAAVMTSVPGLHVVGENPYHDRMENGILTYTAAGKLGEQTLSGSNIRLTAQKQCNFPIHGFALIASRRDKSVGPQRWRYLGLLEYLRHYPDTQLDAGGKVRKVWLLEFRIHEQPSAVPIASDTLLADEVLTTSRQTAAEGPDDNEIVNVTGLEKIHDIERLENVRRRLLEMSPRGFEFFVRDLLVHCGFDDVCVTKYSSDGGVDVNATTGPRIWVFERTTVQIQAKRWMHSVGRKEVAELRGSLRPFAKGTILTTSHFSKAAINEATEAGKNPIGLVDGTR